MAAEDPMLISQVDRTPAEILVFMAVSIALWVPLIWIGLKVLRWFRSGREAEQGRAFEGTGVSDLPAKGQVRVVFHTYYGFLAFVTQTEYRFWADPDEARSTLWRLHKFNCTRGFFAYGGLIIPVISWINYAIQKRRIREQLVEVE